MDLIDPTVFLLVYSSLQYILMISEWDKYSDVVSDIQGYRFNFFKTKTGELALIRLFVFTVSYILLGLALYIYCVMKKMLYTEAFIFVTCLYLMWDSCIFTMFDDGMNHVSILFYDALVVGGVGIVASLYIFNTFGNILRSYIPVLVVIYFLTMYAFLYKAWSYNKN
jgi:hypothetical protein